MAENDESDVEIYVVARFAEWAGDLDYSRMLYAEFGRGMQYELFPERFDRPADVIRFVSELRAARLGEPVSDETRRLATNVFAVEQQVKSTETKKPLLLRPTAHLRAVVHRVGTRDFEMRAYMLIDTLILTR